jgi:hypothetical protein
MHKNSLLCLSDFNLLSTLIRWILVDDRGERRGTLSVVDLRSDDAILLTSITLGVDVGGAFLTLFVETLFIISAVSENLVVTSSLPICSVGTLLLTIILFDADIVRGF